MKLYNLKDHNEQVSFAQAVTPVSYTHLDVYKRQILHSSNGCAGKLINMLNPMTVQRGCEDVYKRQYYRYFMGQKASMLSDAEWQQRY